jgi:raffinose/stachyose/melibiose transport system permease protein
VEIAGLQLPVRIFFIAGLMIPIRLGTLDLVRLIKALNLQDTYWSLIPVYVAMGMPIATFVLTAFIKELPGEMFEAAKIDGASEWQVYSRIVLPLMRPALATVAIFNMIKIWNDFWFPLVFIRAEESRTVALGVSSALWSIPHRLDARACRPLAGGVADVDLVHDAGARIHQRAYRRAR